MTDNLPASQFHQHHNHARCIRQAVDTARKLCDQGGLRFTGIRQRVLELIWATHEPVSAYDLLKELRREKENAEPPTVYRALEFLQQNNLVHRIESLNSFIGCIHPEHDHVSQFLICSRCNQAVELEDASLINRAINTQAGKLGFDISSQTVEIIGTCSACQ